MSSIENIGVVFFDFNFKLCIIEELMYNKRLILPVFNSYKFAENYPFREIDIDDEGYDIISEFKEYFENLIIAQEILDKVEEITLHLAGSTVVHEIYPFWDGEDDIFNVYASEDIFLLKNLRIVYETDVLEDAVKNKLREKGIKFKNW
jgi:hypothetical protein